MTRLGTVLGAAALWCAGCADEAPRTHEAERPLTTVAAPAPAAAPTVKVEDERLARLEARLIETEQRLARAEVRAAAAEARVVDALEKGAAATGDARPVETRSEEEIKAAATGVDDGANMRVEPEADLSDVRDDPFKAEAYNVDPREDD